MARSNGDSEGGGARVARGKLEQAMQDVAEYRRDLIRNQQINNGHDPKLLRGFHAAIMNYYIELDLYSDESQVKNFWENAKMWRDGSGEWVTGIAAIEDWMDSNRTVSRSRPGRRRGSTDTEVRAYMPPQIALRASRQLDKAAKKLSFAVKVGVPVEDDPIPV